MSRAKTLAGLAAATIAGSLFFAAPALANGYGEATFTSDSSLKANSTIEIKEAPSVGKAIDDFLAASKAKGCTPVSAYWDTGMWVNLYGSEFCPIQ